MLQPKKCAICKTINDGSRHFCSNCGAFLNSTPPSEKKIISVWEEEGGGQAGGFGIGGGQAGGFDLDKDQAGGIQMQSWGTQKNGDMQAQNPVTQAATYFVRCPQCGKVHPLPDQSLPNVCSYCFYFFQPGVDQVFSAADLNRAQNKQNTQGFQSSQNTQGSQGVQSSQNTQGSKDFLNDQNSQNSQQGGDTVYNHQGQKSSGHADDHQDGAGTRKNGQGPLGGRSALASARQDDTRLMLIAISNKKMPPSEVSPKGDIIGEGGTIFRGMKTGIQLSLFHTPAGWYARAMQGSVLYNGLPMNRGYQKKLSDGDMFSFDAGQFRVEIIG